MLTVCSLWLQQSLKNITLHLSISVATLSPCFYHIFCSYNVLHFHSLYYAECIYSIFVSCSYSILVQKSNLETQNIVENFNLHNPITNLLLLENVLNIAAYNLLHPPKLPSRIFFMKPEKNPRHSLSVRNH